MDNQQKIKMLQAGGQMDKYLSAVIIAIIQLGTRKCFICQYPNYTARYYKMFHLSLSQLYS